VRPGDAVRLHPKMAGLPVRVGQEDRALCCWWAFVLEPAGTNRIRLFIRGHTAARGSADCSKLRDMREIGQTSPESGRYRCATCGAEIHMQAGETFPSCPGKDHTPRWVLCEELILTMAGSVR